MYTDYTFYLNEFKGEVTEADFNRLGILANAHINRITHGRAKTATGTDLTAVKMAECAVIDELKKQEDGGIITAESNDGISRSFAVGSVVKSNNQRIYDVAELFLYDTNLLFMGV